MGLSADFQIGHDSQTRCGSLGWMESEWVEGGQAKVR